MSSDLLKRLEAVASRLEAYASQVSSGVSSSSSGDSKDSSVSAFDDFYASAVQAFINAAKAAGVNDVSESTEVAFKHVRKVLVATSSVKKPSDADFLKFLDPIVKIITKYQEPDLKSPVYNFLKAFGELASSLSWLMYTPPNLPRPFIQDQLEAADFYLNKVLTSAKSTPDKKDQYLAYASSAKKLLEGLRDLVGANYKTGLEWNPKGVALADYKEGSSSASSAPAAPAAPAFSAPSAPGAPALISLDLGSATSSSSSSSSSTVGGMGAVFAQISGADVTSGLKKVTNDMKSKNLKDVPVLQPKEKTAVAPKAAVAPAEKKEAKLELRKGTWFVEYFENTTVDLPEDLQLKESVYVLKCKNVTINVAKKCKSIQIDGSTKTNVNFTSVLALVEVFNSARVTVDCSEQFHSIAIDKSNGVVVVLSRQAVATPPSIVTSSISECNLVVPGKTDEDDPVEIPLPEQYTTTYVNGKIVTEPVAHSGA